MSPYLKAWLLLASSVAITVYAIVMAAGTSPSAFTKGTGVQLYPQIIEMETPRDEDAVRDLLRSGEPAAEPRQREQYKAGIRYDNIFLFLYPLQLIALSFFAWR